MSFLFLFIRLPGSFSEIPPPGAVWKNNIPESYPRPTLPEVLPLPALLLLLPRSHIPVVGESLQYYDKTLLLPYAAGYI